MEKQLTVIIPTYNMEKYLARCLDSLIVPELDMVEILVINDGSKDRSSAIAHEYADKYPHSITVIDKENGNYGSCINVGLRNATGRYVKILDSDDYFDKENFSVFLNHITSLNSDVILTNYVRVSEADDIRFSGKNLQEYGIDAYRQYDLPYIQAHLFYPLMHLVTYKRSIFHKLNYVQSEGISYTDTEWCFIPFAMCRSFTALPIVLYCYMIGRSGQTVSKEAMLKSNPSFYRILLKMVNDINQVNESLTKCQKHYLAEYLDNVYINLALRTIESKDRAICEGFSDFESQIKNVSPEIFERWGRIPYNRYTPYRVIEKWRDTGYSNFFSLPLSIRLRIKAVGFASKMRKKLRLESRYSKKKLF